MQLPPDTRVSRIVWSIPAALILTLWTIGVLGAAVTRFIQPYTFADVLREIADGGWNMFWPGEFGRYNDWFIFTFVQIGPLLAALLWLLCLIPYRTRRRRIIALVAALLIPTWYMLGFPAHCFTAVFRGWRSIVGITTGEEWQDGDVLLTAATLWWVFLALIIVLTARRRVSRPDECAVCGYSTKGLTTSICPECGKDLAPWHGESSPVMDKKSAFRE